MRDYKILTKTTNSEMLRQQDNGVDFAEWGLYREQEDALIYDCYFEKGFNTPILALCNDNKVYHFWSINEAIESCLSMKDGGDLVEFDNGNYGFIGYYNNHLTYFEILKEASEIDKEIWESFEFYPTIEEYNKKIQETIMI